jgi:protein-disulfide isomerase
MRDATVTVDEADWTLGPELAPITLLEYGNYQCARCAATHRWLRGLYSEYPDRVRLVFRHFPLAVAHPQATLAAEAAEAAGARGAFWPMHDWLFSQKDELDLPQLVAGARSLGIDDAAFEAELSQRTHLFAVKHDFRRGVRDGASEAPSLFVNGRRYDGALTIYALSKLVSPLVERRLSVAAPR